MSKTVKRIIGIVLALILVVVLIVGGYVLYVVATFYRIEDNLTLEISNNSDTMIELDKEYEIMTFNIGFGAYEQDYSFFMDTGEMKTGEKVTGIYGKGKSKESVLRNTNKSMEIAKSYDMDFYLFQEVDTDSDRAFHINQADIVSDNFDSYASLFGQNFHSAFLALPLSDMHGAADAGIMTLSKYRVDGAVRKQYAIPEGFPAKYMDLDRCFTISRFDLENGKQFVLINSHLSAYDEGGITRRKQVEELDEVLKEEYEKGNYVIVGGDFNHNIASGKYDYPTEQIKPYWIYDLKDEDLTEGYTIVVADNVEKVGTCRAAEIPYEKGVNHIDVLDGFIISDNISAIAKNIDTEFIASDHNPVILKFKFNE